MTITNQVVEFELLRLTLGGQLHGRRFELTLTRSVPIKYLKTAFSYLCIFHFSFDHLSIYN